MTIYTLLVVLLVAAAILFKGNKKHSKIFIIIAFLLLFAVMGLRDVYVTGNDTSGTFGSYPNFYKRVGATEWTELTGKGENDYNIGFSYLGKLIYELTNGDYQLFITIISLFVMISYMWFIYKYSTSPIQSILCLFGLLYYTLLFDVIKQSLAMAILLFAFDAIVEKKPVRFVILTVIAALFHFPAIVFIPAYWIGRMKLGRKYIITLAVLLLLTYVFRDRLLTLMLNAYGSESTASMEGIRFLRNKVIIMIGIVLFAVYIKPPARKDTIYNMLLMLSGVAIIFQTFCGYNNIFERLADYYFHTSIILIPMLFERGGTSPSSLDTEKNRYILNFIMIAVYAFFIWRFLSMVNNSANFNQFQFFWQRTV